MKTKGFFPAVLLVAVLCPVVKSDAQTLHYPASESEARGKHIVLLAGDHEYRSEESLPALARILAKHHGFDCTVLFNVDPHSGEVVPGNSNMPGTEALDDADLAVIFLRFQDFSDEQMAPIDRYLRRGGPVVGMRTATHAFKIPEGKTYSRYSFRFPGRDYELGFGRQVLGETWVSHYGTNHKMSTLLTVVPEGREHLIMRGVEQPWAQSGGYWVEPQDDSTVLALAQPLDGMTKQSPPADGKDPCPGAWVRSYAGDDGQNGRVFTTTYGASQDLIDEDFRRMMVNACFWAIGLEDQIKPDLNVDLVGPYNPSRFSFGGHVKGVTPEQMQSYDSPIPPKAK